MNFSNVPLFFETLFFWPTPPIRWIISIGHENKNKPANWQDQSCKVGDFKKITNQCLSLHIIKNRINPSPNLGAIFCSCCLYQIFLFFMVPRVPHRYSEKQNFHSGHCHTGNYLFFRHHYCLLLDCLCFLTV